MAMHKANEDAMLTLYTVCVVPCNALFVNRLDHPVPGWWPSRHDFHDQGRRTTNATCVKAVQDVS